MKFLLLLSAFFFLSPAAKAGKPKPPPQLPTTVMGHLISVTSGKVIEPEYNTNVAIANVVSGGANNAGHFSLTFETASAQTLQVCATAFSYVKSCAPAGVKPGATSTINIPMYDDVKITHSTLAFLEGRGRGVHDSLGNSYVKLPRGEYLCSDGQQYYPFGQGYYYDNYGYIYTPLYQGTIFQLDGDGNVINEYTLKPNGFYRDLYNTAYVAN